MRFVIQRVLALTVKELLALLRDAASRAVLIGPPMIQLLVFGYAATFDLKHVPSSGSMFRLPAAFWGSSSACSASCWRQSGLA